MNICVCICIYIYIYICICVHVSAPRIHIRTCVCIYIYIYVCMYVYIYMCICMYIYIYMCVWCMKTALYKCYTYIYIYMYILLAVYFIYKIFYTSDPQARIPASSPDELPPQAASQSPAWKRTLTLGFRVFIGFGGFWDKFRVYGSGLRP